MGIRGELYSTKVSLENRTYFFNVKENRLGDLYLNIVESKNKDEGGFDRQSIVLFADDLQDFLKGFDDSLRVMEKSVHEKKKASRPDRDHGERTGKDWTEKGRSDREDRSAGEPGRAPFKARGDKPFSRDEGGFKGHGNKTFDREDRPRKAHGDRPFTRDSGGFKSRGDKPFNREEGGFKSRGDKPFNREEGGFKSRDDKPFKRDEGGFKPRGSRPFNRDAGSDSSFGRKKFVKAGKPTAGSHGIKGPMHKTRIVKAVRRKDIPED